MRTLFDSTGAVTDTYVYDAWGKLVTTESTTPTANHYRYTGEQWDNDLGMYYLRARYYRAENGRFWTMDSFEGSQSDPLSLHKYLYAHANPVNGVDPTGHEFNLVSTLTTAGKIGYLSGRTAFTVLNAYSRASSTLGAIQDLAMVTELVADGVDDEDSEILAELIFGFAQERVVSAGIAIVVGVGGKVIATTASRLSGTVSREAIRRTRDWYRSHKANWAGKTRRTSAGDVPYDQHGWPDFSQYLRQGGINTVKIRLAGSRAKDFELADQAANVSEAWRKANGYVWHHHQKLGTMQLVKKSAHNVADGGAPHAGGVAIFKRLYGYGYDD